MIKTILKALYDKGCTSIVYSDYSANELLIKQFQKENIHYVADVRSATFFAFGKAKTQCAPVILLVDELYVSSCYTALMEAWMQRIKVIVITFNSEGYKNTLYLDRCVDNICELTHMQQIEEVVNIVNQTLGPILIKTPEKLTTSMSINYDDKLPALLQLRQKSTILCYCPDKFISDVQVIEERHKYGILSKYIGMLMSGKDYVLLIPDVLLSLDSNIFNVRKFPANFFVVMLRTCDDILAHYQTWIQSNGIDLKAVSEPSEIVNYYNKSNPTIVVIG